MENSAVRLRLLIVVMILVWHYSAATYLTTKNAGARVSMKDLCRKKFLASTALKFVTYCFTKKGQIPIVGFLKVSNKKSCFWQKLFSIAVKNIPFSDETYSGITMLSFSTIYLIRQKQFFNRGDFPRSFQNFPQLESFNGMFFQHQTV